MDEIIRPVSRLHAIELTNVEVDEVGGGANTDFYTKDPKRPQAGFIVYDGTKPD